MIRTLALAAAACGVFAASATSAQEYRIAYGDLDLSTSAGAAAFDRRVERAARAFCRDSARPVGSSFYRADCARAIRDEAVSQLPQQVRADYAVSRRAISA